MQPQALEVSTILHDALKGFVFSCWVICFATVLVFDDVKSPPEHLEQLVLDTIAFLFQIFVNRDWSYLFIP